MSETGPFNPLDVLAAAATSQLQREVNVYNENNNELNVNCSVGQQTMPEGLPKNTTMVIQNSTHLVMPSENGKTMTVLQLEKCQVADHSYAFCRLNQDDTSFMPRGPLESECDVLCNPSPGDDSCIIEGANSSSASSSDTPPCVGTTSEASGCCLQSPGVSHFADDNHFLSPCAAAGEVIEEAITEHIMASTVPLPVVNTYSISNMETSDAAVHNKHVGVSPLVVSTEYALQMKNIVTDSQNKLTVPLIKDVMRRQNEVHKEYPSPSESTLADIKSAVSAQLLNKNIPQTTTLKSLEGKVVTLSVHNKPQQYLVAHKGSLKNKYIIEDDLSPVAKFGKPTSTTVPHVNNVIQIVSSSDSGVSLSTSGMLPMYSAAGNLLEVLPLSDACDKPVQFMSVSGESSGEESPAVILPPPLVIPDDDNSHPCTPLFSGDLSRPVTPLQTSVASIPSDDPTKINLRIGPRTVVGGLANTMPGTPYKLDNTMVSSAMNMNIGSSIGSLSWENLGRAVSPTTTTNSSPVELNKQLNLSLIECIGGEEECVDESSASLPASPTNTSRCVAFTGKRSRTQSLCSKVSNQMHPLVEHDYCIFKQFNAQVQSSILAMTDGNAKTEKKLSKKIKGLRVNNKQLVRAPLLERTEMFDIVLNKPGRGRPKKKLDLLNYSPIEHGNTKDRRKVLVKNHLHSKSVDSGMKKCSSSKEEQLSPLRHSKRVDKNFVKITGSYQDDFVYYTTKNKRKPRKGMEIFQHPLTELIHSDPRTVPSSSGVSTFDWYRDLSKLDKSSRFGMPESSATPPLDNTTDSCSSTGTSSRPAPENDSEMVDLLCDLSAISSTTIETHTASSVDDLHSMAEQVRSMINNMNQNDIQSVLESTSFDNLLPIENVASNTTLSTNNTVLEDLDDINDKDLLYNGMSNIPSLITDLETTSSPNQGVTSSVESSTLSPPAHKSVSSSSLSQSLVNQTPPELTVVSMYWNDLPGLIINERQYVRLVDIHKQVLPAKDTGILKKRCQMMGVDVSNCSDLQRDFLIRYANAAKSKSTVIVDKVSAQMLISFYVEPRARLVNAKQPGSFTKRAPHAMAMSSLYGGVTEHLNTIKRSSTSLLETNIDGSDCKRSSRLKHKVGKYVEMLQGNVNWSEQSHLKHDPKMVDIETDSATEDYENRDVTQRKESLEIKKLIARSQVKPLSKRDKRRLRRLRERMDSKKQTHNKRSTVRSRSPPSKKKLQDKYQYGNYMTEHHDDSVSHIEATEKPITMLHIIHRDNCSKNNQRGRAQQGILHIRLQKQKKSACIECVMCREMFNVKFFMRHQHPLYRPDELLQVSLPQRLELSNPSPSTSESDQWIIFKNRQKLLQSDMKTNEVVSTIKPVEAVTEVTLVSDEEDVLDDSGVVCEHASEFNTMDTHSDVHFVQNKSDHNGTTGLIMPQPNRNRRSSECSSFYRAQFDFPPATKIPVTPTTLSSPPGINYLDTRHSTRVRKRKHMDEYVYNSTATSPNGLAPAMKRLRRSNNNKHGETNTTIAHIDDKTILIQRPSRFSRRSRGSTGRAMGNGSD